MRWDLALTELQLRLASSGVCSAGAKMNQHRNVLSSAIVRSIDYCRLNGHVYPLLLRTDAALVMDDFQLVVYR